MQQSAESIRSVHSPVSRLEFLRQTYQHLGGALLLVVAITSGIYYLLPGTGAAISSFLSSGPLQGLLVLGLVIGSGYVAQRWAESEMSRTVQYLGLGLEIVTWSLLLQLAIMFFAATPTSRIQAGIMATAIFGALTASVWFTRFDFSVLRSTCVVGSSAAVGYLLVSAIFGFALGPLFTASMLLLLSAVILWETHLLMNRYSVHHPVAAAQMLLSSFLSLFWYSLRS